MYCADGFVLLHEVLDECMAVAGEACEELPGWFSQYPDPGDALSKAVAPDPRDVTYCEWFSPRTLYQDNWTHKFEQALCTWLMFRFLHEQRSCIHISLPDGASVRISNQVLHFSVRKLTWKIKESDKFPRDPTDVAYLAITGIPFERRVTLPVYTLKVNNKHERVTNVMQLQENMLAQFDGMPLCWDARGKSPLREVLEDIRARGFAPLDELDDSPKSAPGRPRSLRERTKEAIRTIYPHGAQEVQTKELMLSLKKGFDLEVSADTIRRALDEIDQEQQLGITQNPIS